MHNDPWHVTHTRRDLRWAVLYIRPVAQIWLFRDAIDLHYLCNLPAIGVLGTPGLERGRRHTRIKHELNLKMLPRLWTFLRLIFISNGKWTLLFCNTFQFTDRLSDSPILTLMAEAAIPGANWVSVPCWRTLRHAAKGRQDSNHQPSDYYMTHSTSWATAAL